MSENTENESPTADIRARLGELEPTWTSDDVRTVLNELDESEAKFTRLCTAMANSSVAAQSIMDSRNALVAILRQAQTLTDDPEQLAGFITAVTDRMFPTPPEDDQSDTAQDQS